MQKFSKRKKPALGREVDSVRSRGVWSEVGRGREERLVRGKARFKSLLEKARSSLARMGLGCLFDQVKRRSERSISDRLSWWMASLKALVRGTLICPLFLLAAHLTRLKSPRRIQGPVMSGGSSRRFWRKGRGDEWSEGP